MMRTSHPTNTWLWLGRSLLGALLSAWAMAALCCLGVNAVAQTPAANAVQTGQARPRTTMVVFADRRMDDREWDALFGALRRNEAEVEAETHSLAGSSEFIRGDAIKPGRQFEEAVVVFLHGDCNLEPLARRTAYNVPLGWVRKEDGHIESFAHVDCTRIGQVLGPQAQGLNRDRRNTLMAGAIARVILHEWLHIATQNAAHTDSGIEKAQYGVADLMAGEGQGQARLHAE
jgi:hypothetical protein